MLSSIRLGRAFGIPLFLHPSFFLLPLWGLAVSWSEGPSVVLFTQAVLFTVFACVLLHELGHALMARFFGIATRDIALYPIGGVARLESTGSRPFEEICIALAGPAVNLVIALTLAPGVILAGLAGLVRNPADLLGPEGGLTPFVATFLTAVAVTNLMLMLFNLLPVFPMDGGRVLRALLSLGLGHLRATEIAAAVALVLAVGLFLLALVIPAPSLAIVAVFVAVAGQFEVAALRQHARARAARADEPTTAAVAAGPRRGPAGSDAEIEIIPIRATPLNPVAEVVITSGPAGFTGFLWDRENQVWVRWVDGRPVEAR